MTDSKIKFFFSDDVNDFHGMQFAQASGMIKGVPTPEMLKQFMEMIKPAEFKKFIENLGDYHRKQGLFIVGHVVEPLKPDEKAFKEKFLDNAGIKVDVLKTFLPKEFQNDYDNSIVQVPLDGKTFEIDLTKLKSLFHKQVEDKGEELPDGTLFDFTTNNIIEIKDKKFFNVVEGKTVDLKKENCYTTGIKDGPHCEMLIADFLLNDQPEELAKLMDKYPDDIFADITKEQVAKIDPEIAVKILKKFAFKEKIIGGVKQIENIELWLSELPKEALEKVKNSKLLLYLNKLVNFINGNPVILNVGITEKPVETKEPILARYPTLKMLPKIPLSEEHKDEGVFLRLAREQENAHKLFSVPMALSVPFFGLPRPLVGGCPHGSAATLKSVLDSLIADLERKGKKLREKDVDIINKNIQKLEQLDEALVKLAKQMIEFKEWVAIIGDKKSELVSLGTIENSIAKYRDCVEKSSRIEQSLIQVAGKLCQV